MPRRFSIGPDDAGDVPAAFPSSAASPLDALIASLSDLDADQLRLQWRNHLGGTPPAHLPRWLLARVLAQRLQGATLGDLDKATFRVIRQVRGGGDESLNRPFTPRDPATRDGVALKAGALLVREWNGALQRVMVLDKGFAWNGETFGSLSQIAKAMTGTSWNGHRFFGLRPERSRSGAKDLGIVGAPAKVRRVEGAGAPAVANLAAETLGEAASASSSSPPAEAASASTTEHAAIPPAARSRSPIPSRNILRQSASYSA